MLVFEYCSSKPRAMLPLPMVRLTAVPQLSILLQAAEREHLGGTSTDDTERRSTRVD